MLRPLVLALTVAAAGCAPARHFTFSDTLPQRSAPTVTARWAVGEVFVHPFEQEQPRARDLLAARAQLEQRLAETLGAQQALGVRVTPPVRPDVLVDVEVRAVEAERVNGWLRLGVGVELATLGAGAVVGALALGPLGPLVGVLAATPLAVLGAGAPPSSTQAGHFEATVSLRRPADGAVLGVRHVLAEWGGDVSPLLAGGRLDAWSSEGAADLEGRVLTAVESLLTTAPVGPSPVAALAGPANP